ncbi:MAG: TIGR03085 family protein [Actinophytocola sp.]|nr:TIGR03085 family protein [Actinophytocola sp.]
MGIAADERQALCDLFTEVGPAAPTLCAGWQTKDLAAHLVVRERRPEAAGILLKPLADRLDRVQQDYAEKPWSELVDQVRSGPAWYWPTRIGKLDELANTAEYFIHHEDVRRAQPGWEPRDPDKRRDAALWQVVSRMAKLLLRSSPVGIQLRTPSGKQTTAKHAANPVTITGDPGELLLYAYGRDEIRVDFDGDPAAVDTVQSINRGL